MRRCLGATGLSILLLMVSIHALAVGDTEPPRLVAFDFEPKTVDVALGDQHITFTLRITDETGLEHDLIGPLFIHESWPTDRYYDYGTLINAPIDTVKNRVAGNARDGIYVTRANVYDGRPRGIWRFFLSFDFVDQAGNVGGVSYEDMIDLGFPTMFTVTDSSVYLPIILNSASD